MKKILIINEYMSDNLGDQAISRALKNKVLDLGFESENAPFSTLNPQKGAKKTRSSQVSILRTYISLFVWMIKIIPIIFSYANKKFNYALIGGGQLLLSNRKFPLALLFWVLCLKLKKTKISMIGVGCGNDFNKFEIFCIKLALKYIDSIVVRDEKSKINVKNNFGFNSIVSFDVAYEENKENKENKESKILLVSIIDFSVYERYKNESPYEINSQDEYYAIWLSKIKKINPKEIVFMSTTLSDSMETDNFIKLFGKELCEYDLIETTELDFYIINQLKCNCILSARMHALILGENYGLELYPWLVSSKIIEYGSNLGEISTTYKSNDVIKKINYILTENE